MLTRRAFIGASLLAIPVVRSLVAIAPIREAEYVLGFSGWPFVFITTYTNGAIKARYGTATMNVQSVARWSELTSIAHNSGCAVRVRRFQPGSLDVDWIKLWSSADGGPCDWTAIVDGSIRGACFYEDSRCPPTPS